MKVVDGTSVLSVEIAKVTRDGFRDEVVALLRGARPEAVAKVNAEFLLRALSDQDFHTYLHSTRLNIADGIGVLWAARFLTLKSTKLPVIKYFQILWQAAYSLSTLVLYPRFCRAPIPERIPGVDALMTMLEAAYLADVSVYFLGATPEVNARAIGEIQAKMPGLRIAGGHHGYTEDWATVLADIERSKAALLVVALGCPKQEFWIQEHSHELGHVRVAVGEGGSLDFIAGDFRRAPNWMQSTGLEWFWRLFMNRNKTGSVTRARRIWNAVPVFICRCVQWKIQQGSTAG